MSLSDAFVLYCNNKITKEEYLSFYPESQRKYVLVPKKKNYVFKKRKAIESKTNELNILQTPYANFVTIQDIIFGEVA